MLVNLAGSWGIMIEPSLLDDPSLKTLPLGGTGPYELNQDKSDASTQYVLERRNDDYWDADRWTYDEIVLKVMPDQAARINALRAEEIDGTAITAIAYDEVEAAGMNMLTTPGGTLGFGLFDRDGVVQPALADVRVRQAIGYAFDRENMLESIQLGHGEVTSQIFPNATPVDGIEYDYDVEKAKELLAEAGYADGFELTGVDLGTGNPLYAVITDRLAAIGITMTWVPVSPADALTEMFAPKYPVLNTIWDGTGLGNEPYTMATGFFEPDALWNMFKNEDPELADLMKQLAWSTDEDRDAAYAELDGWVTRNAWLIPLYTTDFLYATSPDVAAESAAGNAVPFLWTFEPAE
jgi:peptide/nickel transport system substrate-binding protein